MIDPEYAERYGQKKGAARRPMGGLGGGGGGGGGGAAARMGGDHRRPGGNVHGASRIRASTTRRPSRADEAGKRPREVFGRVSGWHPPTRARPTGRVVRRIDHVTRRRNAQL